MIVRYSFASTRQSFRGSKAEFLRYQRDVEKAQRNAKSRLLTYVAKEWEKECKRLAPVDTGRLKRSLKRQLHRNRYGGGGSVSMTSPGVPYTGAANVRPNTPGYLFIQRAAENTVNNPQLLDQFVKYFEEQIARFGL